MTRRNALEDCYEHRSRIPYSLEFPNISDNLEKRQKKICISLRLYKFSFLPRHTWRSPSCIRKPLLKSSEDGPKIPRTSSYVWLYVRRLPVALLAWETFIPTQWHDINFMYYKTGRGFPSTLRELPDISDNITKLSADYLQVFRSG